MQKISVIGSEGERYLSELLFVSKFAHRSISNPEIFDKFAEITYSLTSKKSVMTYIEEIKQEGMKQGKQEGIIEGKQEGMKQGRLLEKATATRHMEQLVILALTPKNGKRKTIREVAETFQLSIGRVKAIRAKMV
jgi:predicted transposase YdaD